MRGAVLATALLGLAAAPAAADEAGALFPEGPNRELVAAFCTSCHSGRLVAGQAMSRERWDDRLSWMSANHGMPPLEGEYRQMVLDYLAAAFGEESAAAHGTGPLARPPARKNPFLEE